LAAPALELPAKEEWPEAERLAGEKEVLGFYVTGHPLEKYLGRLGQISRQDSSSLDDCRHDSVVTLAGVLTSLRVRPSKKGDLWASGVLEDMRGLIELLVFPKALQQLREVLQVDAALLIQGRVQREENSRTRVVVTAAQSLEVKVNAAQGELLIRVNLAEAPETLVDELQRLLAAHPGGNPVLIELVRPGDFITHLRPRQPAGVNVEEALLVQLRALCGEESVILKNTRTA
jgi:DNA polymerase-3 subunit alpha